MSVAWSEESWRVHLPDVADPGAYADMLGDSTIPLLAQATAARFPDKVALTIDGEPITHGRLDAEAAAAAGVFAALVPRGSRIVLSGPSSVAFVRAYLGALRAGMVVVLANPAYTSAELQHLVADSGASLTFTEFTAMEGEPIDPVGGPDDVAVLAYTSGTTGKPKGVPLTHRNLLTSIRSAMAAWRWSSDDVLTHALPLFHQHGLSGVHATLIAGSSARIFSKFSDSLAESMRSASVLFAVPTIYQRLVSQPEAFARLRLCVCGSAPLSTALASELPRVPLVRYGTTESGLNVSNPISGPRGDTVGIPLPGVHVRLVDEEIQLRGPQVFSGYRGAAGNAFTEDGWFRTGDLGVIEDGHLVIRGRSKELIITGGMNVYPREVELALESHPAVAEAAVAGLADPQWGEQVTAWVVLREPADLHAHARSSLAPYKVPKQFFDVASLPLNHMGKIDRNRLVSPVQRAVEWGAFVSVAPPGRGIPVAVKDNIAPTATVLRRLEEAGCHVAGRTSLPELAYSVLTPGCVNPWDPSRHAGGSSGGSAVAVAAGAVRFALGTDTGGSVRIPAALCGVVGLRPTFGALPMDGIKPLAPSLDTVGPIARTAADCLWMFTAMGGSVTPVPAQLTVGVSLRFCSAEVRDVLVDAVAALRAAGVEIREVEIPDARRAASSLMQAEARKLYWDQRRSLSPRLVSVLEPESPVVGFPPFTLDVDALLLPTVPFPAARLAAPDLENKYFRFTALASVTGFPALSVPAGLSDGLPVGAQLVGAPGSEATVCRLGTLIEQSPGGTALASARADLVYQILHPGEEWFMDLQLTDKVAFVTGASKGIGRAVAEHLAAEGSDVVITARTADALEVTAKEIAEASGRTVVPMAGDMSRTEDVERCVTATLDRFGHIDTLVTCAGSSPGGLLEELTEEQWMSSLNLKFMGYVRSVRAVIPHMRSRGSGSIVMVVGNDGLKPSYWELTAGVANAADINFASSIAEQYGRYGVRINTVNPGPVDTDRWDGLEKAFARDKKVSQERAHELAVSSIPFGRICSSDEVAALVTFLASPRASFINGAHIPVDGGQRKALMDL